MARTVVFAETLTPYEQELHQFPHIIVSMYHAWDPNKVYFPRLQRTLEDKMGTLRLVSAMDITGGGIKNEDIIEEMVFSIDQMNRKISSLEKL